MRDGLRIQHHPLIRFHEGAGGHRRAVIVGTRLSVYQVIATVRASGGDLGEAAEYLGLTANHVRAAHDYYADFRDEVDADAAAAERFEAAASDQWDRQQRAMG